MQKSDYLVELIDVHKSYGLTEVLKGVNLTIEPGEFVSIRGKSGVGKTNLFKIVGLLETANKGTVNIFGKRLNIERRPKNRIKTKANGASFPIFQSLTLVNCSREHRAADGVK